MDKLLELLNQFEKARIEKVNAKWLPYNIKLSFRPYTEEYLTSKAYKSSQLEVCSKHYGFIQWLVKKNKIDFDKTWYKKADFQEVWNWDWRTVRWYEMLLMLLSISDSPISDLISYLR